MRFQENTRRVAALHWGGWLATWCLLAMQAGCTISHVCPDCGTATMQCERVEHTGRDCRCPICQGGDDCQPLNGSPPCHAGDRHPILAGRLPEAAIGPRIQTWLFEDEPEPSVLPPPQIQRRGPRFILVPTLPVFGPGTEPPITDDGNDSMLAPVGTPQPPDYDELPPPDGALPPDQAPQRLRPDIDYPRGTRDTAPRGVQAEPARLSAEGSGSWTFQPARAAPLGRDRRLTPPPLRAMPRPPARALQ